MQGKGGEFVRKAAKFFVNNVGGFLGDKVFSEERFAQVDPHTSNILPFPQVTYIPSETEDENNVSEKDEQPGPNVTFLEHYTPRSRRYSSSSD